MLEEGVEHKPKERTVPFSHLTEGLGLIEAGIKFFEHIDWNVQQQQPDRELWDACFFWGDSEGDAVFVSPDFSA